MSALRVYVGFDPREQEAYDVALFSLQRHSSRPVVTTPLILERLQASGLSQRPYRIHRNSLWDVLSDAPCSTEFSNSRFLTPLLAQTGWALFIDCDMLFLGDVANLFALADPRYAVMVVKHQHAGDEGVKMDGCTQTQYARKNWSSVMLFNCDHPSNRALDLRLLNNVPGRDLHQFCWLTDAEIGEMPNTWNWLVGVQPKPDGVQLAHYTLGMPFMDGYQRAEHSDLWWAEQHRMKERDA
jgi:lipopolysaccharide biosynthesis glycosyltransferase